jgi:hypothetical protein
MKIMFMQYRAIPWPKLTLADHTFAKSHRNIE